MNELNNPKTIRAWTYYDWANSAYSLIITSAIFPAYYSGIVTEQVKLLGTTFNRAALASYSIALSFLLIAIISPILSSIADYRGNKKSFMKFFCYLGSASCMMMFFFKKNELGESNVMYGLLCSIIASIGYCGSIVFYNAFLPEIATKDEQDKISAKGFAMGYIGSVILMIFCFALLIADEQFGWNEGALLARLSFLLVGLWWILFAQIPFNVLQETNKDHHVEKNSILTNGYKELQKVWQNLTHTPALKKFLVSFFFYNMGVQTVMYMATYFASDELKMEKTQLLAVVLIIQLVAIVGARFFAYISQQKGNHIALVTLVIIWIGICIAAFMVQSVNAFYALAFTVGLVMGGIQSLSRSTYSKLLPHTTDTASYFSFFDVCDKVGIVIGTLSFGLIADMLGGMRNSTLGLVFYFIIGLFLLLRLNKKDLAVMNQA